MKSGAIYDVPWVTGIVSDEGAGFIEGNDIFYRICTFLKLRFSRAKEV